jgi:methanogenic corrinoid protein MtbC1
MRGSPKDLTNRHPIQIAARRAGLTPDVLRVWERRYEAVLPVRSTGGRRFYTDDDLERLVLLRQVTKAGRGIKQVARLSTKRLKEMVAADTDASRRAAAGGLSVPPPGAGPLRRGKADPWAEGTPDLHLDTAIAAARDFDVATLEAALARASVSLGRNALIDRFLVPLMQAVGDLWRDGKLRVAHEHVATAVTRTFVGNLTSAVSVLPETAPCLIVTTPSGQLHEFGALFVAATAVSEGWRAIYLGTSLPAEEIALAARQKRGRAVALSIVYPADDPHLSEELRKLRGLLPETLPILAGGAAAPAYGKAISSIKGKLVPDLPSLRVILESLRGPETAP